jgi:hypothetical protein
VVAHRYTCWIISTDQSIGKWRGRFRAVLTVFPYDDLSEPIEHIASNDSPLTFYWYGHRNNDFERLLANTRSGSLNVNDFAVNLIHGDFPFGGIGQSGTGYYHGAYGFDSFSHHRAIANSRLPLSLGGLLNAPYTRGEERITALQLRSLRRSIRRTVTPHIRTGSSGNSHSAVSCKPAPPGEDPGQLVGEQRRHVGERRWGSRRRRKRRAAATTRE